jgi:hypothetical protein
VGSKTAYLFPWSDVVYYPKTLGVRTAVGRFALEPARAGRLASVLVRLGATRGLGRPERMKAFLHVIERVKGHGSRGDAFALAVTVESSGRAMRRRPWPRRGFSRSWRIAGSDLRRSSEERSMVSRY